MAPKEFDNATDLKIPLERVAVLIGRNGAGKREIEQLTNTKMNIDSKEGDITISSSDPLSLMAAVDVVKAVGRGFNPEIAKLLAKIDYVFEAISLAEYCKTKNDFIRLKGRVIGQKGKSRAVIEDLTGCYICVYGKTVGLIGPLEFITIARRAVVMLLEGAQHATVYKWLERQRRLLRAHPGV